MTIPADTIDKLAETFAALSSLCAGFDEAQWNTPTDLPAWTVKDNLSHLIGTERMLQGLPTTEHRAVDTSMAKNAIGEANEHAVDARRSHSGAEVLAEWNELTALRLTTLRNGDDDYFATPASTPTGPGTLADFLHIRVLDCWSHEQDIRHALDIPGSLDTPSAEHTIDRLIRTLPMVVGKRAATPEGDAVAVELTGPIKRSLLYEVQGGRATAVAQSSSPPLALIRFDSDTFARHPGP